jgi:hypothetical protein
MTRLAAAAALVAVGATPAAAQQPNPWRGESAPSGNPWRGETTRSHVAPMPRPVDDPAIANLTFTYTGPTTGHVGLGSYWTAPDVAQAPMPRAATGGPCCEVAAAPGCPPAGTWYREVGGSVVALTFTPAELRMTAVTRDGGAAVTLTLTADYAVTKDGTVHGVITGADVDVTGDPPSGPEVVEFAGVVQAMVDQPFALRCRPTDGGVMVSNVRFAGPRANPDEAQMMTGMMTGMMAGKFRPVKDVASLPAPKPVKAVTGRCDAGAYPVAGPPPPVVGGMTLPSPAYLQHPPQYFPPDAAVFPLQRELPGPVPAMPCPTGPYPTPVLAPATYAGPPSPGLPIGTVMPAPPRPAAPVNTLVGEWNRTAAGAMIGMSVTPTRLTLRAIGTEDDEPVLFVLTADYKELRDGCLVGVITSADVEPAPGGKPVPTRRVEGKELRAMVDQPISCRYQVQDGELIVIDLKCGGRDHVLASEEVALLIGRYAKGEPKWPGKVKGRKTGATGAGVGAATGGALGAGVGAAIGEPVYQSASSIGAGYAVPPMPPPVTLPAPPVPEQPRKRKKERNTYAPDPNVRMERLLKQSEDLRGPSGGWFFHGPPTHLTPDRIHGGIK